MWSAQPGRPWRSRQRLQAPEGSPSAAKDVPTARSEEGLLKPLSLRGFYTSEEMRWGESGRRQAPCSGPVVGKTSVCLEMVWLWTGIDEERKQGQTDANEINGVGAHKHAEAE
ncbi:unnamed protein product [Coccothraustes coccothraustes]